MKHTQLSEIEKRKMKVSIKCLSVLVQEKEEYLLDTLIFG